MSISDSEGLQVCRFAGCEGSCTMVKKQKVSATKGRKADAATTSTSKADANCDKSPGRGGKENRAPEPESSKKKGRATGDDEDGIQIGDTFPCKWQDGVRTSREFPPRDALVIRCSQINVRFSRSASTRRRTSGSITFTTVTVRARAWQWCLLARPSRRSFLVSL